MTQIQRTPEVQATWEKLERFQLNDHEAVFGFADRLTRENGWTHAFTARVLLEYKRYLLMTMHAGHPVTPSEEVDQAWHLHLVYTRSYWEKLCRDILERPLHHEPTAGGMEEGAKYRQQYQRTLDSYQRLFGEPAPTDIWPAVELRFRPMRSRWVDVSRHWLLPKPEWVQRFTLQALRSVAVAMLAVTLLVACQPVMQMLNMRGGDFLRFYLIGFGIALVVSFLLPHFAGGGPRRLSHSMTDCYDIAFLAGGGQRVLDAALTVLFGRCLLKVDSTGGGAQLIADTATPVPADLHDVELRVLRAVPVHLSTSPSALLKSLKPLFTEMEERLSTEGLMESGASRFSLRILSALPLLLMMMAGVVKVFVGIERNKPVGLLVVLLIFSLVIFGWRMGAIRRRTPAGERLWKSLRSQPPVDRTEVERLGTLADPAQVAMLVAVAGYAALETAGYGALHSALYRPRNEDCGSSISGCSSTSSSGCSSDGGGSSCGSSGCGGCGGGGGD